MPRIDHIKFANWCCGSSNRPTNLEIAEYINDYVDNHEETMDAADHHVLREAAILVRHIDDQPKAPANLQVFASALVAALEQAQHHDPDGSRFVYATWSSAIDIVKQMVRAAEPGEQTNAQS